MEEGEWRRPAGLSTGGPDHRSVGEGKGRLAVFAVQDALLARVRDQRGEGPATSASEKINNKKHPRWEKKRPRWTCDIFSISFIGCFHSPLISIFLSTGQAFRAALVSAPMLGQ